MLKIPPPPKKKNQQVEPWAFVPVWCWCLCERVRCGNLSELGPLCRRLSFVSVASQKSVLQRGPGSLSSWWKGDCAGCYKIWNGSKYKTNLPNVCFRSVFMIGPLFLYYILLEVFLVRGYFRFCCISYFVPFSIIVIASCHFLCVQPAISISPPWKYSTKLSTRKSDVSATTVKS